MIGGSNASEMITRPLGKTGHRSSILAFGGAALSKGTETTAEKSIEIAMAHGINHIDVAPSYGRAEQLLGPLVPSIRDRVFLASKTLKRDKEGAGAELRRSLRVLRADHFDLYQIHGITKIEELNEVLGQGGAIGALVEAREEGMIKHLGITGHNMSALGEALKRFDFETVMFPLNFVTPAHLRPENDYRRVLELSKEKSIGAIAIKAIAKSPWAAQEHAYETWYEPLDKQKEIDLALWFTLSHPIATAVLPSELRLWPKVIDAAERLRELTQVEMQELAETAKSLRPLFLE